MGDCFWSLISNCCTCGKKCANCVHYLSMNSEEGTALYEEYMEEVEKYLEPLYEKMRRRKDEYFFLQSEMQM